jgi:hypothetical protein
MPERASRSPAAMRRAVSISLRTRCTISTSPASQAASSASMVVAARPTSDISWARRAPAVMVSTGMPIVTV